MKKVIMFLKENKKRKKLLRGIMDSTMSTKIAKISSFINFT